MKYTIITFLWIVLLFSCEKTPIIQEEDPSGNINESSSDSLNINEWPESNQLEFDAIEVSK